MSRILLIDDDRSLREVLGFLLQEAGHEVRVAADGKEGIRLVSIDEPDVILTDIRMPGRDGMDVLRHVVERSRRPAIPVIILTAYGTVEEAVEAMKLGAFTYLLKPFNRDEVKLTIARALQTRQLEQDNMRLRSLLHEKGAGPSLIYVSERMETLVRQVRKVAATEAAVLLTGESGTGKELMAHAVHDWSPRWDGPFVALNCGAIPGELMEAELFGHARGAFTSAHSAAAGRIRAADGGTLFLDEIGDLPLALQPKLLRVLEEKSVDPVGETRPVPVDFRLVCATNKNLKAEVEAGRFREDLFYRLDVIHLDIPPLRHRPEDIAPLWESFTRRHAGRDLPTSAGLLARLGERPWPGNVRELKNLNQRMVVLCGGKELDEDSLAEALPDEAVVPAAGELPLQPLPREGFSLVEMEKEIIRRALALCGGNKSRTAEYLGIPRHRLIYRLDKYGL